MMFKRAVFETRRKPKHMITIKSKTTPKDFPNVKKRWDVNIKFKSQYWKEEFALLLELVFFFFFCFAIAWHCHSLTWTKRVNVFPRYRGHVMPQSECWWAFLTAAHHSFWASAKHFGTAPCARCKQGCRKNSSCRRWSWSSLPLVSVYYLVGQKRRRRRKKSTI